MDLYPYQEDAVRRLKTGSILNGGVGSGKSLTSLAYYIKEQGGDYHTKTWKPMVNPKPLYIITTARKRDTLEWEAECAKMCIDCTTVTVDSWNNIAKYADVTDGFFILDEQRLCSYGAWTKSFLKIAKNNPWILLSATPGDTWSDYMPVFIANGFYRNKTDFTRQHVVYSRFTKYPKIDHYIDTGILLKHRRDILVDMDYKHEVQKEHIKVPCSYDRDRYKEIMKTRWNPYTEEPITDAGGLCNVIRRLTNEDPTRVMALEEIIKDHPKVIIFYNFNYELDILERMCQHNNYTYAQWNGHKHERIPYHSDSWVYLVQYTAGAEGWNCVETDTIIFYSQNYSYKIMQQSAGRIDRLNTPFEVLYYYHLKSQSGIDVAIAQALNQKKTFNENKFCSSMFA